MALEGSSHFVYKVGFSVIIAALGPCLRKSEYL